MTESVKDSVTTTAAALLIHYSFDLHGHSADELVVWWTTAYQSHWVRPAVVEALYQGRYKAISVEQILALWLRRGQPVYHFNHEFERIVCSKFPQALVPKSSSAEEPTAIAPLEAPLRIDWPALPPSLTASTDNPVAIPPLSFAEPERAADLPKPIRRSQPEASLPELPEPAAPTISEPAPEPEPEPAIAPAQPEEDSAGKTPESEVPALETVLAEAEQLLSCLPFNALAKSTSDVPEPETSSLEEVAIGQAKQAPIHQFVPNSKSSDFHTKLKAVAQSPEEVRAAAED
jgi:hypothetical protein